MKLSIYTDGSFWWEPNATGGWAAVFIAEKDNQKIVKYISGHQTNTTSNRMEIVAMVQAIATLKRSPITYDSVNVYSDSQYVINSINEWLDNWIKKGKTKKNMDLWKEFQLIRKELTQPVKFHWIKGHNGNEYNELADKLAGEARIHLISNERLTNL